MHLTVMLENNYLYRKDTNEYWENLKVEEMTSVRERKKYFLQRICVQVEP